MFERETLEACQFLHREAARAGGIRCNVAAARDRVSEWEVAIVATSLELSHRVEIAVCEVAGDTTDGVVDSCELGAMREASAIFWSAVGRLGEFG